MIADLLQEIADTAHAEGVAATIAPAQVPVLLSKERRPVLLVDAPTVQQHTVGGRTRVDVPLLLIPAPPGTPEDMRHLYDALEALLPFYPGEWSPVQSRLGELSFPALRTTLERRT